MKRKKNRRRSQASSPAKGLSSVPAGEDKEETLSPEEGLMAPLFKERSDEQPGAKQSDKLRQPPESLTDTVLPLDQVRARVDRIIIQHMKRFPANVNIWDTIAWSKELRAALIKILQEPEVYEAHVTELQTQALEALATEVTFSDKDMLLPSLYHNRPLYMHGWQSRPTRSGVGRL
ncbi:hypothetical protein Taro_009523 [Colocasia esculenta]|uniref:Uncharacterized protein n=1 Tax=Colocasia esculenta TaxID=4460 RepID=A0A843U5Z6_COLES|nr:hypothetical protein [Colocasia esculenta]